MRGEDERRKRDNTRMVVALIVTSDILEVGVSSDFFDASLIVAMCSAHWNPRTTYMMTKRTTMSSTPTSGSARKRNRRPCGRYTPTVEGCVPARSLIQCCAYCPLHSTDVNPFVAVGCGRGAVTAAIPGPSDETQPGVGPGRRGTLTR